MITDPNCVYCTATTEKVIWSNDKYRVLLVEDTPFSGLCRIVWNSHVKELTDLLPVDRDIVFNALCAVESGIRKLLSPHKMNLATLGTQVPHLHWHVIPRFDDDSHYPDPMWAPARRAGVIRKLPVTFIKDMQIHLTAELGKYEENQEVSLV